MLSIDIPARQHKIHIWEANPGSEFGSGITVLQNGSKALSTWSGRPFHPPFCSEAPRRGSKTGTLAHLTYCLKAEANHRFNCLMLRNYLPLGLLHLWLQNLHYGVVTPKNLLLISAQAGHGGRWPLHWSTQQPLLCLHGDFVSALA